MMMTENEIRNSYEHAKNKENQIVILSQLNDCSESSIRKLLGIASQNEKEAQKKKAHTKKEDPQPEKEQPEEESPAEEKGELQIVIDSLYEEMEQLDKEIKKMETRYLKIVTTLYVLNEYVNNHNQNVVNDKTEDK